MTSKEEERWNWLVEQIHDILNKPAEIEPLYIEYMKGLEKTLKLIEVARKR